MEYWLGLVFSFLTLIPLFSIGPDASQPGWVSATVVAQSLGGLVFCVAFVVIAIRSGQGGWRLAASPGTAMPASGPAGDRTPDECWKGGLIYYNPEDPALWVEKRFGFGWTVNFGNRRAWFVLGGILLITLLIPATIFLLMRE
jgi:uncharacterized membrane protein